MIEFSCDFPKSNTASSFCAKENENAARDAHRQRDLLDQAARLRTLRKAVEVLERIAYYLLRA